MTSRIPKLSRDVIGRSCRNLTEWKRFKTRVFQNIRRIDVTILSVIYNALH